MAGNESAMGMAITIPEEVFNDLDRLEGKIKSIEKTTDSVSRNIVTAFRNMANGVNPFIAKVEQAEKAISSMFPAGNQQMEKFMSSIAEVANALNHLGSGRRPVTESLGGTDEVSRLTSELKKQQQEIDRLEKSLKKLSQQRQRQTSEQKAATTAETTFRRAMFYSEATINQRINKIARLREAERQLTATGRNYTAQIQTIRAEMARLNAANDQAVKSTDNIRQSQHHLLDTSGQLMRSLALLFSVSQITQYVSTLARVRGEFELQNAALTAILQNKDEADRLFGQITELAVQSPFQLKELVTYTKELAAYRIENEKLYDTTKMLADVSAGLGVDMSRLILAYGQVKAANYLRGTELRQFSEAGINILGELATYFSEIENRAVSVGEVFDMVSRRMVTFQDVEEIFRRITSEGGIFANMQEVQSRTLSGMISNMKDSVDIMLNDIGQANEGVLKNTVNLVRQLMEHWRTIAAIGQGILVPIIAYSTYLLAVRSGHTVLNNLLKIRNALEVTFTALLKDATVAQKAMNTATAKNPYMLGATIIIGAITAIVGLIRNARREQEELNKRIDEGARSAAELDANFRRLASIVTSNTSSQEEQNAAMEELNRTYQELIPAQYRNIEALEQMQGNYEAVTAAIYAKIEAQTREKMVQDVTNNSSNKITRNVERIERAMEAYGISTNSAIVITREFQDRINNGDYQTWEQAYIGLKDLIISYTGDVDKANQVMLSTSVTVHRLFTLMDNLKSKIEEIGNRVLQPFVIGGGTKTYKALESELNNVLKVQEQWKKEHEGDMSFEYSIEFENAAKTAQKTALHDYIQRINSMIASGEISDKDAGIGLEMIARAEQAIAKIDVSPTIAQINELRETVSRLSEVDFGKIRITEMLPTESRSEYLEKLRKELQSMSQTIDQFYDENGKRKDVPLFQQETLLGDKTLEEYEKEYNALKYYYTQLADLPEETEKKGGKDDTENRFKTWISLIQEVKKEYDDLLKNYNPDEAAKKIEDAYKGTFKEAEMPDLLGTMEFDAEGIIDALRKLMAMVPEEYRILFKKAIDNLETEVGIDVRIRNREELQDSINGIFEDYKLSVDFSELGGTPEMARLLGFDFTTLDELERKVNDVTSRLRSAGGEEDLKLAEKIQDEYNNMVLQKTRENTRKYLEYLNKSKDERLKIEEEYQRQLAELRETELSPQQQQQAETNLTKERDRKLAEYDWEQFKGMDLYRMAFEDLERVGTTTLNILISKLEEFARTTGQTLPTEDFRELMNSLKNVRDELESRNPLKAMVDGIHEYREASEELAIANANYNAAMDAVTQDRQAQQVAQQNVDQAQQDYDSAETTEEQYAAMARLIAARAQLQTANANLEKSEKNLETATNNVAAAENNLQSAYGKTITNGQKAISQYNEIAGTANNIINSVKELADGLGIAFDDETSAAIEGFQKGFSVLGTVMSAIIPIITAITVGGYAMQTALWPLLIIGAALGSIMAIIGAHDAKRDKIIEQETKRVEGLQDQYDELHDHMENALSFDDLDKSVDDLEKNSRQQIEALDKAIAASKDKKKQDEDEIEDLMQQREDALEEARQTEIDRIQGLGGFGDEESMADAAQDFIDTWLDAYKETGDGLDALSDKWDEYIENVISKQMMLRVTDNFLEPVMRDIDRMLEDNRFDPDEAEDIRHQIEQTVPLLNDALKEIAEQYHIAFGDVDSSLSGLQRGIQGVTEETAQVLESLLNSVRYYTADSNMQLKNIYMMLSGSESIPNPMLTELRLQTEQIRAINRLIRNVTASGHIKGGDGLKVFIN